MSLNYHRMAIHRNYIDMCYFSSCYLYVSSLQCLWSCLFCSNLTKWTNQTWLTHWSYSDVHCSQVPPVIKNTVLSYSCSCSCSKNIVLSHSCSKNIVLSHSCSKSICELLSCSAIHEIYFDNSSCLKVSERKKR
jgi:hypothetical protein